MRFKKYHPDNSLKDYVHYYFVIDFSTEKPDEIENNPFLSNHPQGTFDLMFAINGGIQLTNFKAEEFQLSRVFVMAQQEGYFSIRFEPNSYIFGVVFYPESFSKLFNLPLEELTNAGMRMDDHLGQDYLDFHEKLAFAHNDQQCVALFDEFITKQLSLVDFSFTQFDKLIRSIRFSSGNSNIKQLASDANLSERTLQRKMKEQLGIGPKGFTKVIRFKQVLKFINENPEYDWQDILYQCGYYDQAHFIKDFKKYTGKTPGLFLKDQNNLSSLFLED